MTDTGVDDGWRWMVVEIMGHRKHVGRIREVEEFGAKMLRVDVPIDGDPAKGWNTFQYGGAAIFGMHPTTELDAMRYNKPYEPPALTRMKWHDGPHDDEVVDDPDDPSMDYDLGMR